jgi:hypothetical protein
LAPRGRPLRAIRSACPVRFELAEDTADRVTELREAGRVQVDIEALQRRQQESAGLPWSAGPRQGTVAGHKGPPVDPIQWSFAHDASLVLKKTGTANPTDSIIDLWVYKAGAKGFPAGLNDFSSCPPSVCVRYAWEEDLSDPTKSTFDLRSGTWDPASINACPNDPDSMAVGVYMRVRHQGFFPAFFDASFDVSDSSVVKFEPMRPGPGSCEP